MAQQLCRPWDPPTQQSTFARLPGRAAPQDLSESPEGGLLEVTGHWSHFEVVIDAPESWLDVTCRLVRTLGGIDTVLDVRDVVAVPNMIVAGGRVGGVLFSSRGRPGDRFRVEAWTTTVEHEPAKLYALAWGEDGPVPQDPTSRSPMGLYNYSPDRALSYTSAAAPFAVGLNTVFAPNPLPRSRVAVTELVWTSVIAGAGALTLSLQETSGAVRAFWVAQAEAGTAGNGTYVREQWLGPPLWSEPGNGWDIVLGGAGAVGAANAVNVNGFLE